MSEYITGTFAGSILQPTKYECSVHGVLWRGGDSPVSFGANDVVSVMIPGFEGTWCMRCMVDVLDRIGVQRATVVESGHTAPTTRDSNKPKFV